MTATLLERASQRTRRGAPKSPTARRKRWSCGATAVALVHALDDAFIHRQPGVGLGQHAVAAALSLALGLGAVYVFPSVRPGLRSAIAFLFGALATVNGMLHVKHIADSGAAASDLTGALAVAAGVVLIGLAIAIPGSSPRRGRRRAAPALGVPGPRGAGRAVAFFYTVIPMSIAITETHKYREPIGSPPSPDYREVGFEASDGVDISAWYRPTRNGATIIVVHGGGGDRTGAIAHAKLLVKHGYGVLLHDARGRGKSEGVQNAYGWGWPEGRRGCDPVSQDA